MKNIEYTAQNHIAVITLNRPHALNSLDYEMLTELGQIVEKLHTDTSIRAVIFTGAGDRAFCAGADLKERKDLSEAGVRRNVKKILEVLQSVAELPQPTVAAVNGAAFGGGFELLLACDFSFAADTAVMGLTEVSWGIIPGAGGTQRLPRLIGEMRAKELILTARKITAREAFQLGILTGVVPAEEVFAAARKLAAEILHNAPLAVRSAKHAISAGMGTDLKTGLAIEAEAYERIIPTRDRTEALHAFVEKRKPVFTGE
ncbi:enoyl-CoA hydratase-related protein [Peribacillus sp. SCS-26]|uniref:enoyl-CoA hydratase-related protein n=1 Tax=Paraperibacillus marinus TaxID=3115295 RepID=UPI0039063B24